MKMTFASIFFIFVISFSFYIDANLKKFSKTKTTITFNGKIQTTTPAKVQLNGKQIEITVVNGTLPDEILLEKGKIVLIFRDGVSYDKSQTYEYIHCKSGPSIVEKDNEQVEYKSEVYKLNETPLRVK